MSVGGIQGGGPLPVATSKAAGEAPQAAAGASGTRRLDPQQMQQLLREIPALPAAGGSPAPTGAPALPPPEMQFSAEDAVLILRNLQRKATESQLKSASEGVKVDAQKKQELHQKAMQKLQDAAAKTEEAKILGYVTKGLGIAAKVLGIVGGAALVATGVAVCVGSAGIGVVAGAAMAALGAALMGAAALDLAADVASGISQALGGPDLSLMALASKAVEEILELCGVPEEYAALAGTITVAAVQLAVAVGVGLACLLMVPFTAGAGLAGTAAAIAFAGNVLSTTGGVIGGVVSVGSGAVGIGQSAATFQADSARADKFDLDAVMTKLQQVIMAEQDRIEELVKGMDEAMSRLSSMISSSGDTRMAIARRMV